MGTIRIIVTLKPGILDAAGQAVRRGLQALGYDQVGEVRVGRYIEVTVSDGTRPEEIRQMCERFLANPLIEQWRLERHEPAAGPARGRPARGPRQDAVRTSGRKTDRPGVH
ncbi:MAG: phosphoribosylformylglycinamidine synthase subunit PurS [Armatimonadota bacterium]|nr:phosphoribosylformylglycinamidine synthase subunit PurS [Armatimonadota bacterium]MDR7467329.1 phosphoribosylformylglycinamidine synthase subunit PurS [Armatimonadota bacterium]MDR7498933.1 phosphoribosylformylglycinamidine synthase subunit PurS [Armatimonadota bacterium]MDR7504356.1 phosphoribosylformylglycinamidine synthase subunit PurS [Armatimonadota bacterium]MDR7547980.1 phosphoribosylformylglycinamidine synthase subunit PurS [Armatimonadota bacterium]